MSTQAQFRLSHQNWCQKVMTSKSAEKFSADLANFYSGDTLVSSRRTFEFNHGASCSHLLKVDKQGDPNYLPFYTKSDKGCSQSELVT